MKFVVKKLALAAAITVTLARGIAFIASQIMLSMSPLPGGGDIPEGFPPELLKALQRSIPFTEHLKGFALTVFTSFVGTFLVVWLFAWLYNKMIEG